jgi:superfamily II DNA or RNA helicase
LAQYAGRLHRDHHQKKEVIIYDYLDENVPMLLRMYKKRRRGYYALGYDVEEYQSSQTQGETTRENSKSGKGSQLQIKWHRGDMEMMPDWGYAAILPDRSCSSSGLP